MAVSIGPGAESVGILLWASGPGTGRWDRSVWDGSPWGAPAWQAIGCDVGEMTQRWGASQESGILSVAEAGELDLSTIDPNRELDPMNTASPYYGAVKPGVPVRVVAYAPAETIVATAIIDEASYDLASARGRIRALDGIAHLAQAQLPAGITLPNTLRARVRAIVAAVGLGAVVPVAPDEVRIELLGNASFEDPAIAPWLGIGLGPSAGFNPSGYAYDGTRVAVVQGSGVSAPRYLQRVRVIPGGQYVAAVSATRAGGAFYPSVLLVGRDAAGATIGTFPTVTGTTAFTLERLTPATYSVPDDGSVVTLDIDIRINTTAATTDIVVFEAATLVGPDPAVGLPGVDPPVAPYDNASSRPAWQAIAAAGQDALTYIWVDPTGALRFRSWGSLTPAPISIGCKPADADPTDQWLAGLSTIDATASGDAVRNSVRAYSSGTTFTPAATDPLSIAVYGPRPFDVERIVPDFTTWSGRILADRADAGVEIAVGEVRPYTLPELAALLATQQAGPAIIRVRDDAHGEIVDLDTGLIGARIGATPTGWRFGLVTMISRVDWDAIDPTPPVPPIPPPAAWHTETRTYIASSDALLALTSGGSKYGAGAASSLPIGAWSGWTYRSVLAFPTIPWTKVRAITTATLKLRSTTQVRVGFGSSPKTQVRRITSSWSAGSASSPSGSNAVVWPGPNTTSSGAVTASLPTGSNVDKSIRVDALVRAWGPASIGGSGAGQYGLELREASSSGSNTGEVWPVEQGGAARPTLELVLEVFD